MSVIIITSIVLVHRRRRRPRRHTYGPYRSYDYAYSRDYRWRTNGYDRRTRENLNRAIEERERRDREGSSLNIVKAILRCYICIFLVHVYM